MIKKIWVILIISLLAFTFSSCYLQPEEESASISLSIVTQELLSNYEGAFIRVSLYFAGGVALEYTGGDIGFDYPYGGTIYTIGPLYGKVLPSTITPAIGVPFDDGRTYEDFPINIEQTSGQATLEGLVSGVEYQIVVEILEYADFGNGFMLNATGDAGLTSPFTVSAGGETQISVTLQSNWF